MKTVLWKFWQIFLIAHTQLRITWLALTYVTALAAVRSSSQNLLFWITIMLSDTLPCWFRLVVSLLRELVRSSHRLKLLWYQIRTQGVLRYRAALSPFCSLQIVLQKFTLESLGEFSRLSGGCLSKFLEAKKRDNRSLFFDSFIECIQS